MGSDVRDEVMLEEADPAAVLRHAPASDLARVFRLLRPEQASALLSKLDDAMLLQLAQALEEEELPTKQDVPSSDASELERRSPRQVALMRLPWILTTLLIEMLAGLVIHVFDRTLAQVILLASFMPVIQAISGNTGLQSVTMVVRGLATGHVHVDRWWEPVRRQVQTSSIIDAVCAVVVGAIGLVWHSPAFGLVVAISMFTSVNLSGAAGTAIPMLSKHFGFDPAVTAGPFETALQDVLGVTIFLTLATMLLRWLT